MGRREADDEELAPLVRVSEPAEEPGFAHVLELVRHGRARAWAAANQELVAVYWTIGGYLTEQVANAGWGKGTVARLAAWLATREAGNRGLSASNLWRMKQFFETYQADSKLAPLVREIGWSSNLLILAQARTPEERTFYLEATRDRHWTKRELERQLESGLFERVRLGQASLSPALRERYPDAPAHFKDAYTLEFLELSDGHAERDLQRALVMNLKQFLLELGRDFCFVGEEFPVQVGGEDFRIDLLFFHRALQALVAIELKVGRFKPADLGQLQFYLEALDRDHRRSHEGPSIGVLLCKSHDKDVVEYALSRTVSPALVAKYETALPDKSLLRARMDEIYALFEGTDEKKEE
jgi:predicted nuclease of restriction endonuclease-like (RecB) superfamily